MSASPTQHAVQEPALVQIPADGFLMGSNSGQDCERPIHRVWIDTFLLAATQVTNCRIRALSRRNLRRASSILARP